MGSELRPNTARSARSIRCRGGWPTPPRPSACWAFEREVGLRGGPRAAGRVVARQQGQRSIMIPIAKPVDGRSARRRRRGASSCAAGSRRGRRWRPSSASSPPSSARRTPAPCPTARRRCTWRCWRSACGPGDEVITVSHSFIATANAIRYCGATPVFVDIEPDDVQHRPARIEAAITPRTRAILCVHQIGMPCDLAAIVEIARRHELPVIEDAACAIGSEILWDGAWERIGKPHGDIACFSFHPAQGHQHRRRRHDHHRECASGTRRSGCCASTA